MYIYLYLDIYTNHPLPLAGEVNNTDYLVTVTPVKGLDIFGSK